MTIPLALALAILFTCGGARCAPTGAIQTESPQPEKGAATKSPEFEVATIKPTNPNVRHMVGVTLYPGGRVVIASTSLKGLIMIAFDLSNWQISGGDAWVEKQNYDVEAKPPESLEASFTNLRYSWFGIGDERLRGMLQGLLFDRFRLKFHRAAKIGTVYLLERSGKPLLLRPTEVPTTEAGSSGTTEYSGNVGFAVGRWVIFNNTMPQLSKFAADHILSTAVVDRTGLRGSFDYTQPTPPTDSEVDYTNTTDAFLLLIHEVGPKLGRTKGPVETFVIDRAEKPSPN